jgi:hypothetical protein
MYMDLSALPGVLIVAGWFFGIFVLLPFLGHWGSVVLRSTTGRRLRSLAMTGVLLLPRAVDSLRNEL